ncbi:TPA: prepilin-type N-terminal cleavage/methylation domain-containing protein, partial [Escherichia coli]
MIKKKGFTLLEVIIVLGIGTLIAFMKFQDMRNDQEAVLADNVGTQ